MPNPSTVARIVWGTADKYLRNVVEEQDFGDFILPFTVLRRLERMLEPTKDKVLALFANPSIGNLPAHLVDTAMKAEFGLTFYNTSPLSLADIASVGEPLRSCSIAQASASVRVWNRFLRLAPSAVRQRAT